MHQVASDEQILALLATDTPEEPGPVVATGPALHLPDGRDTRTITVAWLRAKVELDEAVLTRERYVACTSNEINVPWDVPRAREPFQPDRKAPT